MWGQGVSSANGTISFYYGNAGNATTGTSGGDVWRLTPHPADPVNGQPVNSTYARIATGQGETPAGGNAATATGPVHARIVYRGDPLQSPENVVIDPANGNLLVASANNNRLVEITRCGKVVASVNLARHQPAGALFGLAIGTNAAGRLVLYYGNSDSNTLHELVLRAR